MYEIGVVLYRSLKYSKIVVLIFLESAVHLPFLFSSPSMELCFCLCVAIEWKYLVFLSLSDNHNSLDLCLHITSSLRCSSARSLLICLNSSDVFSGFAWVFSSSRFLDLCLIWVVTFPKPCWSRLTSCSPQSLNFLIVRLRLWFPSNDVHDYEIFTLKFSCLCHIVSYLNK